MRSPQGVDELVQEQGDATQLLLIGRPWSWSRRHLRARPRDDDIPVGEEKLVEHGARSIVYGSRGESARDRGPVAHLASSTACLVPFERPNEPIDHRGRAPSSSSRRANRALRRLVGSLQPSGDTGGGCQSFRDLPETTRASCLYARFRASSAVIKLTAAAHSTIRQPRRASSSASCSATTLSLIRQIRSIVRRRGALEFVEEGANGGRMRPEARHGRGGLKLG